MSTRADTTSTSRRVLLVYVAALVGREPNGLLEVRWRRAPAVYVEALTGLRAGRDGTVSCPFLGRDSTPSPHVYDDPEAGWYCFGCRRGGSVFDLGGEVFGLSTRGRDFVELRTRLQAVLAAWSTTAQPGQSASAITRMRARTTRRADRWRP